MKEYLISKVRRYPLSCALIAAIWVACMVPVPETPLKDVSFFDKWVHISMYFVLVGIIWWEYNRQHKTKTNPRRLLLGGWLAPLLMGGLIELAQAFCTGGNRSGDWLDFAANASGSTLAAVIGSLLAVCFARGKKDS